MQCLTVFALDNKMSNKMAFILMEDSANTIFKENSSQIKFLSQMAEKVGFEKKSSIICLQLDSIIY